MAEKGILVEAFFFFNGILIMFNSWSNNEKFKICENASNDLKFSCIVWKLMCESLKLISVKRFEDL